jgi:hypothetical protein
LDVGDSPQVFKDLPESFDTPQFGATPDFGSTLGSDQEEFSMVGREALRKMFQERVGRAYELEPEGLVKGEYVRAANDTYPQWTLWKESDEVEHVAGTTGRGTGPDSWEPVPVSADDAPWMIERIKDWQQHYYVVR